MRRQQIRRCPLLANRREATRVVPNSWRCTLYSTGALLWALLFGAPVFAQDTAQITGLVTDPAQAVVAGVSVTVTRTATASEFRTSTNSSGRYAFPALAPGKYSLELKKEGFQTAVANDVELHVADRQELNFSLRLGAVSQTVTVSGSTPLVNTADGSVSTVVDRQFVDSLPLNGRTFQNLIALTPGVVFTPAGISNASQFNVNGQRGDANYFMVDGVSANLGTVNSVILYQTGGQSPAYSAIGSTNSLVSVDAMQEFRIQTSTFAPEFGRSPGGQIGIVTRSGTNQFHGTAFEYFRNDVMDANDWFSNSNGLPKAKERQNDYGGVFGGPILKNQTFFFFSYEGQKLRQPVTFISNVPTLATRQAAPASQLPFLNAFPLPNGATLTGGVGIFAAAVSNPSNLDAWSTRIDQKLGDRFVLFGRYNHSPSDTSTVGAATYPTSSRFTQYTLDTVTGGLTATLSPQVIDELRFNYSKTAAVGGGSMTTLGGAVPFADSAVFPSGITGANGYFTYTATGLPSILYGAGSRNNVPQFNVTNSLSYTLGAHQFKLGADWRRLTPQVIPIPYWISAGFTGLGTAKGGVLSGITNSASLIVANPGTLLTRNFSFYAQDAWKLSRRLTLTYGLRWDINPPAKGADAASALFPLVNIQSPSAIALGTRGAELYPMKWSNIAPRVGISYRLRGDVGNETVLRGGFGLFYDSSIGTIGSAVGNGFPFAATVNFGQAPFPLTPAQTTPPAITTTPPISAAFYGADPTVTTPRSRQWNISVEQALGGAQSLTVSYVGAAGLDLYKKIRYSAPNATFTSSVYITQNTGFSNYDSVQVKFQRRLSHGLQVLASWTWSHALDNSSDDQTYTLTPSYTFNPRVDYGSSDYDTRHNTSAAISYQIPSLFRSGFGKQILGGWSAESLFTARTALPVSLIGSSSTVEGLIFTARPDVVPGVAQYLYGSQYPGGMAFNKGAFVAAPATRQGNVGRNTLRGFGVWQDNLTVQRQFQLTERFHLQFRTEFFNIFNHPNFGPPANSLTSATFGISASTLAGSLAGLPAVYQNGGPRTIQLALRLQF